MKIGSPPKKDLRVMTIKMIQELRKKKKKKMDAQSEKLHEVLNRELGNIKNSQTELKNTITSEKYT